MSYPRRSVFEHSAKSIYWGEGRFLGSVEHDKIRLSLRSSVKSIGTAAPVASGRIATRNDGTVLTIERDQLLFNRVLSAIFFLIGALAMWTGIAYAIKEGGLRGIPGPIWIFCPGGLLLGYLSLNTSRAFASRGDWISLIKEISVVVEARKDDPPKQ